MLVLAMRGTVPGPQPPPLGLEGVAGYREVFQRD
jgi:hypothetical protein